MARRRALSKHACWKRIEKVMALQKNSFFVSSDKQKDEMSKKSPRIAPGGLSHGCTFTYYQGGHGGGQGEVPIPALAALASARTSKATKAMAVRVRRLMKFFLV